MDLSEIKHLAVERIYLIPDASEGVLSYVWCDTPMPAPGSDANEAVAYIRADTLPRLIAEKQLEVVEELEREIEDTDGISRQVILPVASGQDGGKTPPTSARSPCQVLIAGGSHARAR